jgi:hypothetical protein
VNQKSSHKILIGAQAIQEYLQISAPTFKKFVKKGLPAVVIDNRWYAHTDNLDAYFQQITRFHMKEIPEDAE